MTRVVPGPGPANAVDRGLRELDPRWPEGPKPGAIVWGSADGTTTTKLHFHVPEREPRLNVNVTQTVYREPILWWKPKPLVGEAKAVNPTNMGITSRLTDLYSAVQQLDLSGLDSRRLPEGYRAKPNELAVRLHGEQGYYVFDLAKDPHAHAVLQAAQSATLAVAVGDASR